MKAIYTRSPTFGKGDFFTPAHLGSLNKATMEGIEWEEEFPSIKLDSMQTLDPYCSTNCMSTRRSFESTLDRDYDLEETNEKAGFRLPGRRNIKPKFFKGKSGIFRNQK